EIEVAGGAFCRRNLHRGAVVDQQQGGGRLIAAEAARHHAQDTAAKAAQAAAATTGLAGEVHGWAHGVVGSDHLTLLEVAAGAALIATREIAFAHHVVHGPAALHDDEAVGLLDHQAQHRH